MRLNPVLAVVAATLVAGCGSDQLTINQTEDIERLSDPEAAAEAELRQSTRFDAVFEQAGAEFNVPAAVLKAISYVETRYEMVQGHEEFEGRPASIGLMGLRGPQLEAGAVLAGLGVADAKLDPLANVRAAAALLDSWATEENIDRSDVRNWAPVVARLTESEDPEVRRAFVNDEVFSALKLGVGKPTQDLVALGQSLEIQGELGTAKQELSTAPDYGLAVWRPSPNYNYRPSGDIGKPAMVIIHTCEGSYTSCWSWLTNTAASASAHYVVNSTGSEISQLVRESHRAWHIAATYNCSLNSSVDCWRNGYSSNHFTIGIEHAGYASQTSFSTGMIDASAKLTCDISKQWGIPRDRYHILGHGQLQPYNRTDPGPNWPWTTYLNKVNSFCGTSTAPASIIIDSNNGNNDQNKGYISVSSNWISSNSTSGYYGTGYWYASTAPVSDGATFYFYMPTAGTRTIDAWWTAGSNRSTTAPFVVFNSNGTKLATKYVNQQTNGSKWNALGTWSFTAGWNKVVLSRWTTEGSVVIADAIRVR